MRKGLILILGLVLVVVMCEMVIASEHILTYRLPITEMSSTSGAPNCKYIQTDKSEDVIFNKTRVCWNPIDNYFYSAWIWDKITLIIEGVTFKGEQLSTYGHLYWNGGDIDSVYKDSISNFQTHLYSNGSSIFVGTIEIQLDDSLGSESDYGVISIDGIIINDTDYEQRISTIESWKQEIDDWKETIEDWKDTITTTLAYIMDILTSHTTTLDDHESRIETLETYSGGGCGGCSSYLKYLSNSDRRNMICGYAAEMNVTKVTDLGYNCTLEYKYYSSGRRRITCRCKEIKS